MTGPSGMASSNPLVIVVDDDAAVRNSLKFALEIEGFVVITYESAEQLVDAGDLSDRASVSLSTTICRA